MKSLNFVEFNSYVFWIEQMVLGAQLQDVWTNDQYLVLEFYKYRNIWLVCDLQVANPQLLLIQKEMPPILKRPKPVGLFISSHGCNLRVESLKTRPEWGRVVDLLVSGPDRSCLIQMQIVPTAVNVLVTVQESNGKARSQPKPKKISWDKARELPKIPEPQAEVIHGLEATWLAREDDWWAEWWADRAQKSLGPVSGQKPKTDFEKLRAKKQKAIDTIEASLQTFDSSLWRQLGELLKTPDSQAELSPELQKMLDPKISRSENMALAFKKVKDLQRKKSGALERIEKLKLELASLSSSSAEHTFEKTQNFKSTGTKSLEKAEARGRKLQLAPGLEAVCGRSGRDNLAILRQARAWDLWLHLKDYPGAHAIIFRDKNKLVESALIEKVSEWVLRESPAARGFNWGGKYEVVVAETRFVRPIKGDSLGRVTYQNPTVYTFASKPVKA